MLRNIALSLLVAASSVVSFTSEATAGEYGSGSNYFEICNEASTSVAYKTDETYDTHVLQPGDCDKVWTDWDYIIVNYDESDADGWQDYEVQVNYPDDLSFYTFSDDYYTVIDHYLW